MSFNAPKSIKLIIKFSQKFSQNIFHEKGIKFLYTKYQYDRPLKYYKNQIYALQSKKVLFAKTGQTKKLTRKKTFIFLLLRLS